MPRPKMISAINDFFGLRAQGPGSMGHSAFTLIELLIVIVIIGVIAGLSAPQLKNSFDNFELENFAKEVFYLCRYLQGSAIGQGKIYYLDINKDTGQLRSSIKEESGYVNLSGRFGRVYKAPPSISLSLLPGEKTGTYFYPDGSIEEITITLENSHKKKLSIIIKGAAGEIRME